MKRFFHFFLIFLALMGVGSLGYYAYHLSTDTLIYSLVGTENQEGDTLRILAKRPSFFSFTTSEQVWDTGALISSFRRNGQPWNPTVSGEGSFWASGEYLEFHQANITNTTITLDADVYNKNKTTQYRLPRSVQLKPAERPYSFSVAPIGSPKDKLMYVNMYGYTGLTPDDVRFFVHYDAGRGCDVQYDWDSTVFQPVFSKYISTERQGQIEKSVYRVDYDSTKSRVCLVAGVRSDIAQVIDRSIDDFTLTGGVDFTLSPEYNMQSEVSFSFSSPIFADTGSLYSTEYIASRQYQKIEFLKHLDISPEIPMTESQIALTPSRVTILGDFQEGTTYRVRLNNIEDIYGRKQSVNFSFQPSSEPFLSLGLPENRKIFRVDEPIDARMYSVKTPKDTYTMKLCQISLEGYSRVERLIDEKSRENIPAIYTLIENPKEAYNCTKSDIVIASGATVSHFLLQDMYSSGKISPGLYILAPKELSVATEFEKAVIPQVFSVIDSEIALKIDASGKMNFLVTDINTGKPRGGQSITLQKNISQTYTESWDALSQKSTRSYLPFTNQIFSTGSIVGKTLADGTLNIKKDSIVPDQYSPPYSLTNESNYEYEGRYESFLATAEGSGHFGYVVSTWNDGITGWNFGLKEYDYAWDTRAQYSAYIHTDRLLYLPQDEVHIHAIIRENEKTLTIPSNTNFIVRVTNPLGAEIATTLVRPNEFGTISLDVPIEKNAVLGNYSIQITPENEALGIENGYATFQVEIFKNPTFTADVQLKSPDIENDILLTLRKKENIDPLYPWYESIYATEFSLNGVVKAHYYNGAQMKGVPFHYRVYRAPYYDANFWGDCFWGCYYEPTQEFYTEGSGVIDQDGLGIFHVPVQFESFYDDYVYTAEVSITDPMTGENVVTPATLLARIPREYKQFDPYDPLNFTPEKRILKSGEVLSGTLNFQYGNWNDTLKNKYEYILIHRVYNRIPIDDLRINDTFITNTDSVAILSGSITSTNLQIPLTGLSPGEYHVVIRPKVASGQDSPESSISDTLVYIAGDFTDRNANLRVIPEKTIYHQGEIARVFISSPFTGGYLYLTRERGGVIDHEYVEMTGSTLVRDYVVDDTFAPNVYLGAIAYPNGYTHGGRNYAVGYGEIITDLSDKKGQITIKPDKELYKNRDTVHLDLTMQDKQGNPLSGEIALMVVDESLIRLLGNIDLDIIPKFFRKASFTMKTALTAIGMDTNKFISRKGSNGGSGDKGGGGSEVSSRILFQNTAYYNPYIYTNKEGKASVDFPLPDNITDYRVIAIGQTKSSIFSVAQNTIPVRRDYTIESHVPTLLYPGDTSVTTFTAFNSTNRITKAEIILSVGSGGVLYTEKKPIILQSFGQSSVDFSLSILPDWIGDIPYTVTLSEGDTILDRTTKNLHVTSVPLVESVNRYVGILTGGIMDINISPITRMIDPQKSYLTVGVSRTPLTDPESLIQSLITYPYGCIEQTIASTIPNAIALKFSTSLNTSLDTQTAKQNLEVGLAKILRMQSFGGWRYWEDDINTNPHVTPYVVRSLYDFRDLGVDIPQTSIDAGIQYLADMIDYQSEIYADDPDIFAEIYATLSLSKDPRADALVSRLENYVSAMDNPNTAIPRLSRHGLLMYRFGQQYFGKLSADDLVGLEQKILKNTDTYWYWNQNADRAIYARLLTERGDTSKAMEILDGLVQDMQPNSNFVSTQTKIQTLLALTRISGRANLSSSASLNLSSDGFRSTLSIEPKKLGANTLLSRSLIGEKFTFEGNSQFPVFYELIEHNIPSDIFKIGSRESYGMHISRMYELVDESRGVDTEGNWLKTEPVTDSIFQKGKLYKVTLTVTPPKSNTETYYLTLEDLMPGAWRPIRGIFQTESRTTSDNNGYYWNGWSHVEAKEDRILATAETLWSSEPQTYTYYVRPEYVGTYTLPPAMAYFMYHPEIHAISAYEQIRVTP